MERIKIKYLRDIEPIEKVGGKKSDWIDLRCAAETRLLKGAYALIPLGVAMELPEGYEAIVAPRSSTFKHFGIVLAGSIGIIDEEYCGDSDEWMFPAIAMRDTIIPKNARICQFRIFNHQPEIDFEVVDCLNNDARGGIGSTGW